MSEAQQAHHTHEVLRRAIDEHPIETWRTWRADWVKRPELIRLFNADPSTVVLDASHNFGVGHLGNEVWHRAGIGAMIKGAIGADQVSAFIRQLGGRPCFGYLRLTRLDAAAGFMSPEAPFYGPFVQMLQNGEEDVFVPCEFFMHDPEDDREPYPRVRFPDYPLGNEEDED